MASTREFFEARLADPAVRAEYEAERARIDFIDSFMRSIEDRRAELGLTKADLARRCGLNPASVRKLLTTSGQNPTLGTLFALGQAMGVRVKIECEATTQLSDVDGSGPVPPERGRSREASPLSAPVS